MSLVLVVEDDTVFRSCISETLRDQAYKVLVAETGRIAMRQIDHYGKSLAAVITDQFMPNGLNGVDVVMYLRESRPDIPVVMVSGNTDAIDPDWAARYRVHLLPKPFTTSTLVDLLNTARSPASLSPDENAHTPAAPSLY